MFKKIYKSASERCSLQDVRVYKSFCNVVQQRNTNINNYIEHVNSHTVIKLKHNLNKVSMTRKISDLGLSSVV